MIYKDANGFYKVGSVESRTKTLCKEHMSKDERLAGLGKALAEFLTVEKIARMERAKAITHNHALALTFLVTTYGDKR